MIIRLSENLLRWRWWLCLLAAAVVIFVEVEEHLSNGQSNPSPAFWREVLLFGVAYPLINGIILTLLARSLEDRSHAVRDLDQQYGFSRDLSNSPDWQDLVDTIVAFPRTVAPIIGASLHVYNPDLDRYELASEWAQEGVETKHTLNLSRDGCEACTGQASLYGRQLIPCPQYGQRSVVSGVNTFCLPLIHAGQSVALLHVDFPAELTIVGNQIRALSGAGPEMALALERARLQQVARRQAEAATQERRRIAANLHDTLGQNISYLRLRLDQLSGENVIDQITDVRQELERMREIADDAYRQVRSTLSELQNIQPTDLAKGILELARAAGGRAGFSAHVTSEGRQWELEAHDRRQALFICREALNNVEKHARARTVNIDLLWGADGLDIRIHDDGVGFDPQNAPVGDHYGLMIMRERASDLQAELKIHSAPGSGTEVHLRLPSPVSLARSGYLPLADKTAEPILDPSKKRSDA
jgi:signal transduction histidine kinase